MNNIIKWGYLLQLAGLDDGGVAVLVVGQTKQDVVANGPRHDPGSLWWEGYSTTVSNFTLRWHQLSQDHHEQGTLEETWSHFIVLLHFYSGALRCCSHIEQPVMSLHVAQIQRRLYKHPKFHLDEMISLTYLPWASGSSHRQHLALLQV